MFDVMSFPAILLGISHHFKFCWCLYWKVWLFVSDSTRWISKADYFLFPVFIQLNILNIIITTVLRYDLITVNKVKLTNTNTVNHCIIHEELSNWFPAQWWVSYSAFWLVSSTVNSIKHMAPGSAGLYTWEDVIGKRELIWSCGQHMDQKNTLTQVNIPQIDTLWPTHWSQQR